jgi:hypothetical protein
MTSEQQLAKEELGTAHDRRSTFLFVFLLLDIILYPYAGDHGLRYQFFRSIEFFVTFASVYAVSFRRSTWIIALIFAVPVACHRVLVMEVGESKLALVGLLISFAFDVFIVVVLFRRVFRTQLVTSATILGALSIYLMVGFAFSRLYQFLAAVQPHAFYLDPALNDHIRPSASDLIYCSFGTMTSLGAVGVSPVTAQARSLSIIEAILGILYLGVLVSRLIAMYVPQISQNLIVKAPHKSGIESSQG